MTLEAGHSFHTAIKYWAHVIAMHLKCNQFSDIPRVIVNLHNTVKCILVILTVSLSHSKTHSSFTAFKGSLTVGLGHGDTVYIDCTCNTLTLAVGS